MRKDSRAPRSAWKRISSGGVVLALVALFGLPTAALAVNETTISLVGGVITVQATAGAIKNRIITSEVTTIIGVEDQLAGEVAGAGCVFDAGDGRVECPKAGVTSIVVNLDGEDDILIPGGMTFPYTVNGGAGDDNLQGSTGNDVINGGAGIDVMNGRVGGDAFTGGTEKDEVSYSTRSNPITVTAGAGAGDDGEALEGDTVGDDVEVITGGDDNDSLTGGTVNNTLNGGLGNDTLHGGTGDDTLVGGGGGDDLFGDGNTAAGDTVSYNPESRAVNVTAGTGVDDDGVIDTDPGLPGAQGEGDTVDADVENIAGGSGADNLVGGTGPGIVSGNSGNDTLSGDPAATDSDDDVINGGGGIDTVSYAARTAAVTVSLNGVLGDGQAGESDNIGTDVENATGGSNGDTLTGNASVNVLRGLGGNDTLSGGDNNDRLFGGLGNDGLTGGAGTGDWADYSDATGALNVTIDGSANDGVGAETDNVGATVENVLGGAFNDIITGSISNNTLTGGTQDALVGNDTGQDTLTGGGGNDILNGLDDNDTLSGQSGNDTLAGGLGGDVLNGGTGTGDTTSYAGRATFVNVTANGGVANDGEVGEGDNVDDSVDIITGTAHNDIITSATGSQTLNGGLGNDDLNGGVGTDTVNGGGGNDLRIEGGFGTDSLVGGSGDDVFDASDVDASHPGGYKDNISCGPGTDDFSDRNANDVVAASCP